MAWLGAGYPASVPSMTVERKCGSSQQAIDTAAQGIVAGAYDIVIAGGVESMSRVPMGAARMGADPYGRRVAERWSPGLVGQGIAAELVAARWGISRREADEYSAASHARADRARTAGCFAREIVPVRGENPAAAFTADETIRPGTTVEALGALRPAFVDADVGERFPEIDWMTTAGNSSQITDGASVLLLVEERTAERLGLRPRARIVASAVCGSDPLLMLTGPIAATEKVLARSGLTIDDIAHAEVNEAFAPVPLAWQREIGLDPALLNPRGGAIALGHPLGASGARLMTTLLHALEDEDKVYGLQTMCEAGGMANATVLQRL